MAMAGMDDIATLWWIHDSSRLAWSEVWGSAAAWVHQVQTGWTLALTFYDDSIINIDFNIIIIIIIIINVNTTPTILYILQCISSELK